MTAAIIVVRLSYVRRVGRRGARVFWYLVILAAVVVVGVLAHGVLAVHGREFEPGPLFICLLFFAFMALRASSVGADTYTYEEVLVWVSKYDFSQLAGLDSDTWYLSGSDVGYRYYAKTVSLLSDAPRAMTVANSAVTCAALYVFIRRSSADLWLSCFLFFTLGFFQLSMNLAPSFMGLLVVACGYGHMVAGRFWRFVPYVLLGAVFHPAMLFMVPVYFIVRIKLSQRRFFTLLAVASVVALFFYPAVLFVLRHVVPARYISYFSSEVITLEKMLVWVSHLAIFGICWYMQKNREDMFRDNGVACWLFLLESVVYLLSSQSTGLGRVAYVLSPYLIVTIPALLQTVRGAELPLPKRTGQVDTGRQLPEGWERHVPALSATKTSIVILCVLVYIARLFVNNIGTTMPYLFFWM